MSRQDAEVKKLLLRFYPCVTRLVDYLCQLLPAAEGRKAVEDLFTPPTPCSSALASSLASFAFALVGHAPFAAADADPEGSLAKSWKRPGSEEEALQMGNVAQVVEQAQARIFRQQQQQGSSRLQHILTLGYRGADERANVFQMPLVPGSSALTNFYVNTNVTRIVLGLEWQRLLLILGPDVLLHLLISTSLFQPIEGSQNCFVQLLGVPIADRAELQHIEAEPSSYEPREWQKTRKRKRLKASHGCEHENKHAKLSPIAIFANRRSMRRVDSAPTIQPPARGTLKRTKSLPLNFEAVGAIGLKRKRRLAKKGRRIAMDQVPARKPSEVVLVRNRIYYARQVHDRSSRLVYGLPFAHIFNRSSPTFLHMSHRRAPFHHILTKNTNLTKVDGFFSHQRAVHIAKYIWPREFGLHNVFTSAKERFKTSERWQEYSHREKEITARGRMRTPQRLNMAVKLVAVMLRKHDKLDYRRLLDRCASRKAPSRRCLTAEQREEIVANMVESDQLTMLTATPATLDEPPMTQANQAQYSDSSTTAPKLDSSAAGVERRNAPRFTMYRTSTKGVARFLKLVLRHLVPHELFGSRHNRKQIFAMIDTFVFARRFETLSLHHIIQSIRITDCHWLLPTNRRALAQRPTAAEMEKRKSMLCEFVYYLFDSIIIPSLRTCFYATESAAFRNRTLFFRQDDWLNVSAPVLEKLKTTAFEPVSKADALAMMSKRNFGYSYIRLLPKETGVRPIVNLRRRSQKVAPDSDPGKANFQQSINSILESTFHILNYEKAARPDLLGASVFGANEIYLRLRQFKRSWNTTIDPSPRKLYFVKVDVKCAFDTIDQTVLFKIVNELLSHDSYIIQKYARVMPAGPDRAMKEHIKRACPEAEQQRFEDLAGELATALRHVIFSDSVVYARESRERLIALLEQHVRGNLVRIGKDFCRQTIGIPQGSSLSTLLCSYYFAQMEREKLSNLGIRSQTDGDKDRPINKGARTLLLRYTDDFLLVTSSKSTAIRFFDAMNRGFSKYGCSISPAKSLCNFDLPIREKASPNGPSGAYVPRVNTPKDDWRGEWFPWCGILICTKSLAVMQDLDRYRGIHIADTLTVEYGSAFSTFSSSSAAGIRRKVRPGQAMQTKLLSSIKSRCHIIFADSTLHDDAACCADKNTGAGETARLNLYQACLVAALKLISYWQALSRMKGGRGKQKRLRDESKRMKMTGPTGTTTNKLEGARMLLNLIKRACRYVHECLSMRAKSARLHLDPGARVSQSVGPDKRDEVVWLGLHAFEKAIKAKRASRPRSSTTSAWDVVGTALKAEMKSLISDRDKSAALLKTAERAWSLSQDVVHSIHVQC